MSRAALLLLVLAAALAGCKREPPPPKVSELEKTLAQAKAGEAFPVPDKLGLGAGQWRIAGFWPRSSNNPFEPGGEPCNAYGFVLEPVPAAAPIAAVATFCGEKNLPSAISGAPFLTWPIQGDAETKARLDVLFHPALRKDLDVLWVTERAVDAQMLLRVHERAWRARDGKLEQILDLVGLDPSTYADKVMKLEPKKRVAAAAMNYVSGFVGGSFPRTFEAQNTLPQVGYTLKYDYFEGSGYRTQPLIPGTFAGPRDAGQQQP